VTGGLFDIPAQPSKAHARRTDPDTSHEAAKAVTPATDTIRADVERWARGQGAAGFIDEELSKAFGAEEVSSYRTRRAELTLTGQIVDTRRRRPNSNMRQCIVWIHSDYRHSSVPFEPQLTLAEQLERRANQLDQFAKDETRAGYTIMARELAATADLIRKAMAAGKGSRKPEKSDKGTS
jgi:hypothetical protein